ncbi:MAG: hypothetical protein Ct9H300mP20_20550 [Gammaproteobacteria bacterium]|nr:MAG: hypothetical protein Ct9H300mP20_20550 [Gammaproteobacteria bacterium]
MENRTFTNYHRGRSSPLQRMEIIASMQPSHPNWRFTFCSSRLGLDRVGNGYPWRNLIDLGCYSWRF